MTERKIVTREEIAAGEEPRRRPSFTETMQIGIVVRDLDAAVRRYVDDYGIGPWGVHLFQLLPGDIDARDHEVRPQRRLPSVARPGESRW